MGMVPAGVQPPMIDLIVLALAALRAFSGPQRGSAFLREYQPPWFPHGAILQSRCPLASENQFWRPTALPY